jgi:hypothetical protein
VNQSAGPGAVSTVLRVIFIVSPGSVHWRGREIDSPVR